MHPILWSQWNWIGKINFQKMVLHLSVHVLFGYKTFLALQIKDLYNSLLLIQLFRQRLSYKMFIIVFAVFQQEGKGSMKTHVCAVFFFHAEIDLNTSTHNTFQHCRVCLYAFVGQPLSKQLYNYQCSYRSRLSNLKHYWCSIHTPNTSVC